jgi:hypothetical protein
MCLREDHQGKSLLFSAVLSVAEGSQAGNPFFHNLFHDVAVACGKLADLVDNSFCPSEARTGVGKLPTWHEVVQDH